MRFRRTKKELEGFSDACFVEVVLTARKYELNPYGPLARRIDRTIARVHEWHSDPDEVKAAAEEQGLREFVFKYRGGEITVSIMAVDEKQAWEKLVNEPVGTVAGPLDVEVEFGRLWQEYWQLLGLERSAK